MITDKPNVTNKGGKISLPKVLFSIPLCNKYPRIAIAGITNIRLRNGFRSKLDETVSPRKADSIMRSP